MNEPLASSSVPPEAAAVLAAAAFPKRKNRGNMRKKEADGGEDEGQDESAVIRKAKQARGDPLTFTTKTDRTEDLSGVQYDSNQAIHGGRDSLATAMIETETQTDRDARYSL